MSINLTFGLLYGVTFGLFSGLVGALFSWRAENKKIRRLMEFYEIDVSDLDKKMALLNILKGIKQEIRMITRFMDKILSKRIMVQLPSVFFVQVVILIAIMFSYFFSESFSYFLMTLYAMYLIVRFNMSFVD